MAIPFIQLPFARVRFVDDDHKVNSFADLPNAFLNWTPKLGYGEEQVVIKNGVPHHVVSKKKVLLQIDRLFRRADARDSNKLASYMKDIAKAIQQMTERAQFLVEHGPGTLDMNNLRTLLSQQNAPTNRISVSMVNLPGGQRELKNFLNMHLDRLACFSLTAWDDHEKAKTNQAFAGRHMNHNAITGTVHVFGDESTFAVSHPLVDLRTYFTKEQIENRIIDAVDENFPWMKQHNLFHSMELDM